MNKTTLETAVNEFAAIESPTARFNAMAKRVSTLDTMIADCVTAKKAADDNVAVMRARAAISGQCTALDLLDDPAALATRIFGLQTERGAVQELLDELRLVLARAYESECRHETGAAIMDDSHARQVRLISALCRLALENGTPVAELPRRIPTALAAIVSFDKDRAILAQRLARVVARYPLAAIYHVVDSTPPTFPPTVNGNNPPPTPTVLAQYRWALPAAEQLAAIRQAMAEKPAAV